MMTTIRATTDENMLQALESGDLQYFKNNRHKYDINHRLSAEDFDADTLLLYSISDPNSELYAYFLQEGADVHLNNCLEENIFHALVFSGDTKRLDAVLRQDPSCAHKINEGEVDGFTPLHYAILFEERDFVDALIDLGADTNRTDHRGCSALHLACIIPFKDPSDSLHIVKRLLERGADPLLKTKDGNYPLALAINKDLKLVYRYLWQHLKGVTAKEPRQKIGTVTELPRK